MQADSSGRILGRCVCCLAEGKHRHGGVFINFLEKCLNIHFACDPLSFPMCSDCIHFVKEVKKFRAKVLKSQKELQDTIYNEETVKKSIQTDSGNELHEEDSTAEEIEYKIKPEKCDTKLIYPEENEYEIKTEKSDVKLIYLEESDIDETKDDASSTEDVEMEPEYLSDWDTLEDEIKTNVKIVNENTTQTRRLKSSQHKSQMKPGKKKRYDVEMTSTQDLKLGMRRLVDNQKIRANIIMILKNSTITPFLGKGRTALKCFYCKELFLRFADLKQHMDESHRDVNDIPDDTMDDILKKLPDLVINADISCIKCKLCDDEFKSIENLVSHLNQVHDKKYYSTVKTPSHGFCGLNLSTDTIKCHICHEQFSYVYKLATHLNEHYGTYICSVCKMRFISEFRCKAHLWTHKQRSEFRCKKCNKLFSTENLLAKHLRTKHAKNIKCLKCPETFPLGQYMRRVTHMEEVHGIKKPVFKCNFCGKEYQSTKSLSVHKKLLHTPTKEYTCGICGYVTTDGNYMPKHMNMHSGIKKFECGICNKKLATATSLKMHMRAHMNDKRFACSLCDAAFVQKHCLKNHLKAKHPAFKIEV